MRSGSLRFANAARRRHSGPTCYCTERRQPDLFPSGGARAANTTPEEWLDQIVAERREREDLLDTTRVFSEEMRRKMAAQGVKPSDVEREIAAYRRGR
jgi:hypothetical protein